MTEVSKAGGAEPRAYVSSEDSALLRSALGGLSGSRSLEIGAGNGGNVVALAHRFDHVVGTDLVKPEMRDWSLSGADFVLADRGSCLRDRVFDLVVFNPPYLGGDEISDVAVDGGPKNVVPVGFLREALRVVKDSGKVLMLLSNENELSLFEEECNKRGFAMEAVGSKHLFFEELTLYEVRKRAKSL